MTASFAGKALAFWVAAVTLVLDLWSKSAVFAYLEEHGRRVALAGDWLAFVPVMNEGAMWGVLPEYGDWLRLLRVGAVVVVLMMVRTTPAAARVVLVALGLVLGGAIGNIYDGFRYGAVRDFVMVDFDVAPFDPFPVFNVADSGICVGVALLALTMFRPRREEAA